MAVGQTDPLRSELLAVPITDQLGGATTRPVATPDAYTFVAGNADDAAKAMFSFGNQMFTAVWKPAPGPQPTTDGLGPLFNRESCFDCHLNNGRGAAPAGPDLPAETALVRISIPGADKNGGPNPVPVYGDQIQDRAIAGVPPEARVRVSWTETPGRYGDGTPYSLRAPTVELTEPGYGAFPPDIMMSLRVANPVIGGGLLEAVPEATLVALSDPDDADGDGISGRVNRVFDATTRSIRPGRFGWKANAASLAHQNAAAALGDMGITTPEMPYDLCLPGQDACAAAAKAARVRNETEMSRPFFDRMNVYMQLVAVPKQRGHNWPEVRRGEAAFRAMGCAACHMPTLIAGTEGVRPELAGQTFHPFTDLLLHDMGEGLADHRPDWQASGSEWRTAPLWGIGLTLTVSSHTYFLHDGRARDLAEAILWHGGEAEAAREAFRTADKAMRDDLIAFLNSL
ncbi:MAG: di-heme oxidoredictase family protein [Rhodospirillaceae bacterium]|nr:di-heme oxidoredictase family protein [Rhodospirillaceae bacterium]